MSAQTPQIFELSVQTLQLMLHFVHKVYVGNTFKKYPVEQIHSVKNGMAGGVNGLYGCKNTFALYLHLVQSVGLVWQYSQFQSQLVHVASAESKAQFVKQVRVAYEERFTLTGQKAQAKPSELGPQAGPMSIANVGEVSVGSGMI